MITRDFLESKGFTKNDFSNGKYTIINRDFAISLYLIGTYPYCYLYTDDSDYGVFFDKLNEDKLNCILDFMNNYNKLV